jgi:hypothetical protein
MFLPVQSPGSYFHCGYTDKYDICDGWIYAEAWPGWVSTVDSKSCRMQQNSLSSTTFLGVVSIMKYAIRNNHTLDWTEWLWHDSLPPRSWTMTLVGRLVHNVDLPFDARKSRTIVAMASVSAQRKMLFSTIEGWLCAWWKRANRNLDAILFLVYTRVGV